MRYLSLILLLVCSGRADERMEPVSVVHELLNYAVELPDKRVCVLTPQRLALLASADATELLDSHWTTASGRHHFAVHKGHALVANWQGIDILRIDDDGFEKVGMIEIRYAWQSPLLVAHDQLFVLQAGRDLNIFSLADITAPVHRRELQSPQSGASFLVEGDHLYWAERKRLSVYNIRDPKALRPEGMLAWPISRAGAMHLLSPHLYVSAESKLYTANVGDFDAMSVSEEVQKISAAEFAIPRPDGFVAFSGFSSSRVLLGADGVQEVTSAPEEWPILAADSDATRNALASSGLWSRRMLQCAVRIETNLLLLDGQVARVYDLADSANPKLVGSCEFVGVGRPVVHGTRVFTPTGTLDLSDPANPVVSDKALGSYVKLDGDTLYRIYGRELSIWSLAGEEMEKVSEHRLPGLDPGFLVHDGLFYHVDDDDDELRISQLEADEFTTLSTLALGKENGRAMSMVVEDGLLYIGTYYKGIRLVNVEDPKSPRLVADLSERQRYEQLVARHGIVFGSRGSRELVAVDMRRKMAVVERGPMLGRGYLSIMDDLLLAATPGAGVGIFRSQVLKALNKDLRKQAPLRKKLATDPQSVELLSALAQLCASQGDVWAAERCFAALKGKQLDADTQHAMDEFELRRKADADALAAAAAFTKALREDGFGEVEREDGRIIHLRVFKPALISAHTSHLTTLPLRSLELTQGPIGADELALLTHYPGLTRLRLRETDAESADFAPLATLTDLEHLNLEDAPLSAGALAHIAGLASLEYLDLEGTGATDAHLAHIAGLINLNVLDLEGCPISDAGLAHLSELRKLETLRLEDCRLTGEGFQHLAGLKLLENFDLEHVPAAEGYAVLAGMKQLEDLDLDWSGITDAELIHLAGLKKLEDLQLGGTKIGSDGVTHLAGLGRLATLDLSETKTDDRAMILIGAMNNLEHLDLRSTDISDDGLALLAGLKQLETLSVENIPDLSNDGLGELAGLKKLERVTARGTSVNATGAALLPQSEVYWKTREAEQKKPEEEEEKIQAMPTDLGFLIAEDTLRLINNSNGQEYSRESPADMFGMGEIELRAASAWGGECWVASDQGLLRFSPRTRAWSRFAIDRRHLDVSVDTLAISQGVLVVGFAHTQEARFDLSKRRWLSAPAPVPAAVAVASVPTAAPARKLSWVFVISVGLILLGSIALLRRAPK
jgi:Leucine-rich repeat (LRR) protein